MNQEEHWMDTLIYNATRIAVIFPIMMIVAGVSLNVLGYRAPNNSSALAKIALSPTPLPANPSSDIFGGMISNSNASETKLDLTGPWVCKQPYGASTIEAYVKNRNIYVSVTSNSESTYMLVNGDCLYSWTSKQGVGGKKCNIASLLSIGELLLQFNALDQLVPLIANNINTPGVIPTGEPPTLSEISKSCKKESIEDTVFKIPLNIIFSEETAVSTIKPTTLPVPTQ